MEKEKASSRLTDALLEMANDLRRVGIMDEEAHREIVVRHLGGTKSIADYVMGEGIGIARADGVEV